MNSCLYLLFGLCLYFFCLIFSCFSNFSVDLVNLTVFSYFSLFHYVVFENFYYFPMYKKLQTSEYTTFYGVFDQVKHYYFSCENF